MNTPVSFELAKLLKEKGFIFRKNETYYNPVNGLTKYEEITPTIAEVVMWMYEKHSIWIAVNRVVIGSDEWDYGYIISYLPKEYEFEKRRSKHLVEIQSFKEGVGSYHGAWYTPTEAYEAAIEYTLKNLI